MEEKARVTKRARLTERMQAEFAKKPVAYWVDLLNDAGVPCGPVYTVPQMFEDEQIKALKVVAEVPSPEGPTVRVISQPVTLSRTPATVQTSAPGWGAHTEEVLKEAGYSDEEIKQLRAEEAV